MDTPDFSSYLNDHDHEHDDHDLLASAATETPMDWHTQQSPVVGGSGWEGYSPFPQGASYSPALPSFPSFPSSPNILQNPFQSPPIAIPNSFRPAYPQAPMAPPSVNMANMSFISPSALMPVPDTHLAQPAYQPLAWPASAPTEASANANTLNPAQSVPVSVFSGSTNGDDSDSDDESDTSFDEDDGDELRAVSARRVSQAGSLSGSVGAGWGSMGMDLGMAMAGEMEEKRPNKRARCESELGSVADNGAGRSVSGSSIGGGSVMGRKSSVKGKKANSSGARRSSTKSSSAKPEMFSLPTHFTASLPGQPHPGTGKKPWNTTPLSTHLPSGSQLINPLTNELDLKPELLEGLTKEEVRKVKNRASAQRSRTRKWEMQEGMRGECERLREELDMVRAELDAATGGAGGERMVRREPMGDEEKQAMEALIVRLRGEVHREKEARVQAESELHSLRAQLDSLLRASTLATPTVVPTHTPASSASGGSYGIPSPSRSSEPEHELSTDGSLAGSILLEAPANGDVMDGGRAEKGEMLGGLGEEMRMTVVKKGGRQARAGKDGKGVLMMVVLFSFALFSLPPHLRTSHPSFHLSSSATQGKLLPFETVQPGSLLLKNISRQGDVEVVVVNPDEETDDCSTDGKSNDGALCPVNKPGMQMLGTGARKGDAARGRKSFSFTLLRPMGDGEDDLTEGPSRKAEKAKMNATDSSEGGNVEDVLSRWLGLSLFDAGLSVENTKESKARSQVGHANASEDGTSSGELPKEQFIPGGWVVVDSSIQDSRGQGFFRAPQRTPTTSQQKPLGQDDVDMESSESAGSPEVKALTAWDGSKIEMMDLDTEVLSISAPQVPQATIGSGPDPSKTLAPHILEDPLADEEEGAAGFVLPGAYPESPRSGRGSGAMPSAALMALGRSAAERYMKLELEMDIEVEVRTVGLRRKGGAEAGKKNGGETGLSVVGKEEVGRMLKLSGGHGMGLSLPAGEGEMGSGWTMM